MERNQEVKTSKNSKVLPIEHLKNGSAKASNYLGLKGTSPSIEYVLVFMNHFTGLKKKYRHQSKLSDKDLGHLTKAAWIAFNLGMSQDAYLETVFSKYQQLPRPCVPRPDQLCSEFATKVADAEQIKKVEVPPEIRAHDLAKKAHGRKLDHDSDYKKFMSEFKLMRIENIEDAEFKCAYCRMRDVQTTAEPSEFIKEIEERIAIARDQGGDNE